MKTDNEALKKDQAYMHGFLESIIPKINEIAEDRKKERKLLAEYQAKEKDTDKATSTSQTR